MYHSIDVNGDDSIAIDEFIWYCKRRVREISLVDYLLLTFHVFRNFFNDPTIYRHTKVGVDNIAVTEFDAADADGSGELSVTGMTL